jgi:hypothetical protein
VELEALLRAHGFMRVEHPPELWEVDSEIERFLPMLGEMIALGLSTGTDLSELTLNVSNVVVEPDEDPDEPPWLEPGEYVAITVRGSGGWGEDDAWRAGQGPTRGPLANVGPRADEAGAVYVYTRELGGEGSVTALLPRRWSRSGATD